jgi:hypothetical protein
MLVVYKTFSLMHGQDIPELTLSTSQNPRLLSSFLTELGVRKYNYDHIKMREWIQFYLTLGFHLDMKNMLYYLVWPYEIGID